MKNFFKFILASIIFLTLPTLGQAQLFNTADIAALSAFVSSTNGGSLSAPSGWNAALPAAMQWKLTNPYDQWYGVTWTPGTLNRRVQKIELGNLGYGTSVTNGLALSGRLPNNFISLTSMNALEVFDISGNRITDGPLIPWVYTSTTLKVVNISDNRFGVLSGATIFLDILTGALALEELYARNYLSGTAITVGLSIPLTPSNLTSLKVLDFSENGLLGSVSVLLSSLSSLEKAFLNNNKITQLSLNANSVLEEFAISFNELDSTIYIKNILDNYSNIKFLDAANAMSTTGTQSYGMWTPFHIPATNINNDIIVNISNNKLLGAVNLSDPGFVKLASFNISGNKIASILPPASNLTNLKTLDISDNLVNQPLDIAWFSTMPNIEVLNMSDNQFFGELPTPISGFYNFVNLKELALSGNNIDGAIRLDWILDAQNSIVGAVNTQFESLRLNGNNFSEVVLYSGQLIPFNTLAKLHVQENRFEFDDLYAFVRAFRMVHQGAGLGYRLINVVSGLGEFLYGPQAPVGIGGVRRRNPNHQTIFRPNIHPPILENSNDTLYNEYSWFRRDTSGGIFNTEFLGRLRLSQINTPLSGTNVNINLGSTAISNGSLNLLPNLNAVSFGSLGLLSLDSTHNGWIYFAEVRNDSFPGLSIATEPVRLLVANCYDSLGHVITCQQILVRFDPDSIAAYSPGPALEAFKEKTRRESGAYKIEECQCGDLELWEMYDTTNTIEVEQFGTGTRSTAGSSSSKAELLSAEPNYYVESNNYSPPTSPPATLQGTAHSKPTLVAIIDSGTDFDHPYLKNRFWINTADANDNGIDDDNDCVPDNGWGYNFLDQNNVAYDDQGHGTAIAGIIGGFSDYNISQNTGTYDSLALVSLKFTDKEGNGTLYHAACALFHATQYTDPNNAKIRVVNASWGYYGEPSPSLESAINYAGTNCGMLIITSAGNDGVNNDVESHYPSNFENDNIITVAAVRPSGASLDSYSNYGLESVDLAARGDDVSTAPGGTLTNDLAIYGTSFATAQVSRAAGLLFHAYPEASSYAVKRALIEGVDELNSNDNAKLLSGGCLNLQKSMQVMASITNRSECSTNILVSDSYVQNESVDLNANVFPNPFNDNLQIELFSNNLIQDPIIVNLYSIEGRLLKQQVVENLNTNVYIELETKELALGLYLLHINSAQQKIVKKIVKIN